MLARSAGAFYSSTRHPLRAPMQLATSDWVVMALYGVVVVVVGLLFVRRAGAGTREYFLSGRSLPWWLIGTSMVATTFSTDTPNLVTDLVRTGGVSRNWLWWAFLITGMCTVFFYAKLWRRSGVFTDVGFYELRYSGRPAAFLRGFRALYLGVFFNVMIMATVTLAAVKISGVLLGVDEKTTVLVAGTLTVLYSATTGLWGVVVTDLLLFVIAMVGSIAAAYYALAHPDVGGLANLMTNPAVADKLAFLPDFSDWKTAAAVFIIPISVQWWSIWYPGAEPGGGGYIAQRMLAARDEREAMRATLWFNIAHYALRPWPWIIVALCSLVVYPDLAALAERFPHLDSSIVRHDLAYPAMLVFVPHGLLGLVVASLAAAYMSTISTHLNWGASYIVDDFYRRFVDSSKTEAHYVMVARVSTVALIVLASIVALWLEKWRINAWSELSAMIISLFIAIYFQVAHERLGFAPIDPSFQLVLAVGLTTIVWLAVTWLTPPADTQTLQSFYDRIRPFEAGWRGAVKIDSGSNAGAELAPALLAWFLGCTVVYTALFGTGYLLYGNVGVGMVLLTGTAVAALGLFKTIPMISFE